MLMSLQLHLWTTLQHTCVQCLITNALQHWSEQNAFLTAQTSLCKLAALVRTTCIPHCLVLQSLITTALQHWSGQNAYLTTQSCSAKQAVNIFLSLQIDLWVFALHIGVQCPSSVHCSIVQDKMHFSLPCAALQNRLTACWCHCKWTFGYLLNIHVCSVSSPMHYSTGQNKMHSSLPRVPLQNRLSTGLCHCK